MRWSGPKEVRTSQNVLGMYARLAKAELSDEAGDWFSAEVARVASMTGVLKLSARKNPLGYWAMAQAEDEWSRGEALPLADGSDWKSVREYVAEMSYPSIKHMLSSPEVFAAFPGLEGMTKKKGLASLTKKAGCYMKEGRFFVRGENMAGGKKGEDHEIIR